MNKATLTVTNVQIPAVPIFRMVPQLPDSSLSESSWIDAPSRKFRRQLRGLLPIGWRTPALHPIKAKYNRGPEKDKRSSGLSTPRSTQPAPAKIAFVVPVSFPCSQTSYFLSQSLLRVD